MYHPPAVQQLREELMDEAEAMRSAFALTRYGGNFRVITEARKLERATGIEPV